MAEAQFVGIIDRALAPTDLVLISVSVPDDGIDTLDIAALPKDWRASPAPIRLRELRDEWVATAKSLALRVPSVIVPSESNVLINPQHPRFAEVQFDVPKSVVLDPRLTLKSRLVHLTPTTKR